MKNRTASNPKTATATRKIQSSVSVKGLVAAMQTNPHATVKTENITNKLQQTICERPSLKFPTCIRSGLDNMAVDETSKGVCSPRAWVASRRTGCRATSCGTCAPNDE